MKKHSIITKNMDICYLCGQYATEVHHVVHGCGRRKLADEDRLTVGLCRRCHMNLHDKGTCDRELQKIGQRAWMEHYHKTINDFINRFGKSYI